MTCKTGLAPFKYGDKTTGVLPAFGLFEANAEDIELQVTTLMSIKPRNKKAHKLASCRL